MNDFSHEDVLEHARDAFAETIALKLQHLRKYVAKRANPTLTGDYVEAIVRGFIEKWIGNQRIMQGTFFSEEFRQSGEKPMQIDGIVYDPSSGPTIVESGDFVIVHPCFCSAVIEIKTSMTSIPTFETRLQDIWQRYFHHLPKGNVMGIVVADSDPEKSSQIPGTDFPLYDYHHVGICPIFVLFKEDNDEFTPHMPAIHQMICRLFNLDGTTRNYLG